MPTLDSYHTYDLAIIGAGPIGLESALYAAACNLDFILLEKDQPGATMQQWGFLTMFSTVSMNLSPLARKTLGGNVNGHYPTGREMKIAYLDRLAADSRIAPRLRTGVTVNTVSRDGLLKNELIGDPKRADTPFLMHASTPDGEAYLRAHRVIDASGVHGHPNHLGPGGAEALGERSHAAHISYHLKQIDDAFVRSHGRRLMIVGAGHSACTIVNLVDDAAKDGLDVEAMWVTSKNDSPPVTAVDNDPLPERRRMTDRANQLATTQPEHIIHRGGMRVRAIHDGDSTNLNVELQRSDGAVETVAVDHIFAMLGYSPDRSLYEQLQVHECYASFGPMKYAAHLLSSGAAADCLSDSSEAPSDDLYNNPEPNFYILGAKSYGRTTNFLINKGHDQIQSVFRQITGDPQLNLYEREESTTKAAPSLARVKLDSLDNLWFQVGGTICNLHCDHCFISCSPDNDKFKMMTLEQIRPYLDEAREMGVKEFYFTGGEPFLNEEIFEILQAALKIGPASVLTNGTIISERRATRLAELDANSMYSLEIRVSLDGFDARSNDRLRGKGNFDRAIKGVRRLVTVGLAPIITAVQTWKEEDHPGVLREFTNMLESYGYANPRLKIMPALDLGAYKRNHLGDGDAALVTADMMNGFDESQLICNHSRLVAHDGVYVCPILIDFPDARMGKTIGETTGEYELRHPACYTCYISGAICSNFSSGGKSEP